MPCCCFSGPSQDREAPYRVVSREQSLQVPPSTKNAINSGHVTATTSAEDRRNLSAGGNSTMPVEEEIFQNVMERKALDDVLCNRMNWNLSAPATPTAMIAVAKFKRMAVHAHDVVSKLKHTDSRVAHRPTSQNAAIDSPLGELSREEKIEEGKKLLHQRLELLKLAAVDMVDDGNCQFRAFSLELFGTQDLHEQVRGTAVAWLHEHSADFSYYIGGEEEWKKYLREMSTPKTWGDELTLRAVCDAYGVVIHLITTEKEHWHAVYEPAMPKRPFRHIFLAYISPIHYNTVELL